MYLLSAILDPSELIKLDKDTINLGKLFLEEEYEITRNQLRQNDEPIRRSNSIGEGFLQAIGETDEISSFELDWNTYLRTVKEHHPEDETLFWKKYHSGNVFDLVAKKILAIPASSALVERLFSYAGLNEGKLRTSMAADIVEACIMVYNHHTKKYYFPKDKQ